MVAGRRATSRGLEALPRFGGVGLPWIRAQCESARHHRIRAEVVLTDFAPNKNVKKKQKQHRSHKPRETNSKLIRVHFVCFRGVDRTKKYSFGFPFSSLLAMNN